MATKIINQFIVNWSRIVIERRWLVILLTLVLFVGLGIPIKNLYFDNSNEMWFLEGDPALVEYDQLQKRFGDSEYLLIGLEPTDKGKNVFDLEVMKIINEITAFLEDQESVTKVSSLTKYQYMHSEDDVLTVENLVDEGLEGYGGTQKEIERLEKIMDKETLVHDLLITRDFRHTIISARALHKKKGIDHLVKLVRETVAFIKDKKFEERGVRIHYTGTPYINEGFFTSSMSDQKLTYPLMFLLIVIVLTVTFRGWVGVVMPLVVIFGSVIAVLGMIGAVGWAMNMLNVTLPVILMAVGVGDSIHILVDFYHNRNKGLSSKDAAVKTTEDLFIPCFNTSLTTAIGFGAISVSRLQPLSQFGLIAAFGIMIAFLISLSTLPALLSFTRDKSEKAEKITEIGLVARLTMSLTGYNHYYRYIIVGGGVLITAVSLCGASLIDVDSNFVNYFKKDTQIRQDLNYFNDTFNGGMYLELMVDSGIEGGAFEPGLLKEIEGLQVAMEKVETSGKTNSIVNFLKKMNQSMHNDDPSWYLVPNSRELVAQYLLLYSNSGPEEDLTDLKTLDDRYLRVSQRFENMPSSEMKVFIDQVREILRTQHPKLSVQITGRPVLFNNMDIYILEGLIKSFTLAIILIVLCFFILLRSFKYGLLALIPSLFPILFAGGLMGFMGVNLEFATMVVAAITFGIAVDDTIHFLSRFIRARKKGKTIMEACHLAVIEAGRALIFTSLILFLGFSILMLSSFTPNIKLGFFAGVILLVALISSLTLLPAVLFVFNGEKRPNV